MRQTAAAIFGVLIFALMAAGCGSDDPAPPGLSGHMDNIIDAEARYYKENGRYTENFADLSLQELERSEAIGQPPGRLDRDIASPGYSLEISVSSDGKYATIQLSNNDQGHFATLRKGGQQSLSCQSDGDGAGCEP